MYNNFSNENKQSVLTSNHVNDDQPVSGFEPMT